MNIAMAGVDYRCASIETREKVSFSQSKIKYVLAKLKQKSSVSGAAIISTCNRTEIYISYNQCNGIDPIEIFCDAAELSDDIKKHFYVKRGIDAALYLFELACGIHSMIFGEDQIISQVKEAINIANDEAASDAKLNTLFRWAITCAKKVKTEFMLCAVSPSVASQSVQILRDYLENNNNSKALVIGNGVVGRKVCAELLLRRCEVYMTIRNHKTGCTIIPDGCKTVDYDNRQELISQVDILISATSSPHQTVTLDMVNKSNSKPKYIIDLAIPRDIDPEIGKLKDIAYYNIDSLGETARKDNTKEIYEISILIQDHMKNFSEWCSNRERFSCK